MSDSKQDEFEQRAQSLLQESAEHLDGATRSRLTQARHAALDAVKQHHARRAGWFWLMPASGAAAAAVVAVLLMNQPQEAQQVEQVAAAVVDELDIVTAEDSLEFYRDVEFYTWLDTVIDQEAALPESEA